MKRILLGWVVIGLVGCGGTSQAIKPLTDEEKAAIKARDGQVDDEEKAGSGKSTRRK